MRVLIVGGGGFLGRAIVQRLLESGLQVVVLDLPARLDGFTGCDTRAFDFSDGDARLESIAKAGDRLLHLGCTSHPAASMQDPARDAEHNVVGSVRLFQEAEACGVDRVVFASSGGTVYGHVTDLPVDERQANQPLSAYGVAKLAVENYLGLFARLRGVSLRVSNPYGPGQLVGTPVGAIAHFLKRMADNAPITIWGDGRTVRDYIAVEDVAEAFHLALTAPGLAPGPYNVGSGVGTSLNDLVGLLRDVTGRAAQVTHAPPRDYDVPAIILDSARFSRATGWAPKVPLEDGVRRLWRVLAGASTGCACPGERPC